MVGGGAPVLSDVSSYKIIIKVLSPSEQGLQS